MNGQNELSFDRLLEMLAEKLANKIAHEPSRLYPRLFTIDQAAVYLGWTREAVQHLVYSGKIAVIRADQQGFLDRHDLDEWIEDNKVGWASAVGVETRGKRYGS